jgi:ribose transport system substrate-binding protein
MGHVLGRVRLAAVAVAAAMSAILPALSQAQEIVVSEVTSLENEYFSNWDRGARDAARALGLEFRALTNEGDPNKQLQNYEAQLRAGARLFFGNAQNVGNIPAFVSKVRDGKGKYAGVWDTMPWYHPLDVANNAYAGFFAPDDSANAYEVAVLLFKKMGGKGSLVHITGFPGSSADVARNDGVERALKEFPGIKVVARQPGNWNQVDSRKVMEDIIVANPKIDGVFGQNDSTGVGALQAAEEAGLKIPIVGLDGNAETLKLIKEGRFYATVSNLPEWQAGYALVRAYDAAHGWKPSPTEAMMFTGAIIVTAVNVDAYQKFISGPKLPFDWRKMSRVLHPNDWDPQNRVWAMNPEVVWGRSKVARPASYQLPKAFREAVSRGEDASVNKAYDQHYKQKLPL